MVINAIFRESATQNDQKGDLGNILKGQLGETEVENKMNSVNSNETKMLGNMI